MCLVINSYKSITFFFYFLTSRVIERPMTSLCGRAREQKPAQAYTEADPLLQKEDQNNFGVKAKS